MPTKITRIFQLPGHCGPTSVQMLLRVQKVRVSQRAIAQETQAGPTIHIHGCRIDQLSRAVSILCPDYTLLAKYDSTIEDLCRLCGEFGLPVGVEWRGMFTREDGSQYEDGHYSVVTEVDAARGMVKIIDPDETSVLPNGEICIAEFEDRWWDENWLGSPIDPAAPIVRTYHLTFVVVPRAQEEALSALGYQPPTMDLMRAHHRVAFDVNSPSGEPK